MNWRRGLLLTGINLAVATPLIFWNESRDVAYVRDFYVPVRSVAAASSLVSGSEDTVVAFSGCSLLVHYPAQKTIVEFINFPAAILSGWRGACPERWQYSGMVHANGLAAPTPSSIAIQQKVDRVFLLLIALQWMLVGGFSPSRLTERWREPGTLITICGVLAGILVTIGFLNDFATFPALFAFFAWLWLFGLAVWKSIRSGRTWNDRRRASHTV